MYSKLESVIEAFWSNESLVDVQKLCRLIADSLDTKNPLDQPLSSNSIYHLLHNDQPDEHHKELIQATWDLCQKVLLWSAALGGIENWSDTLELLFS